MLDYAHLCLTFPLTATKLLNRFNSFFSLNLSESFIKGLYYSQNYCVFIYLVHFTTQFFYRLFSSIFNNYLDGYYLSLYCKSLKKTYFDFVNKQNFTYILSFKTGRRRYFVYKGVFGGVTMIKNSHFYRVIRYNVLGGSMTDISLVVHNDKRKYFFVGLSMKTMRFVKFRIMAWQEGEDAGRRFWYAKHWRVFAIVMTHKYCIWEYFNRLPIVQLIATSAESYSIYEINFILAGILHTISFQNTRCPQMVHRVLVAYI